jgi:hypothetical protein
LFEPIESSEPQYEPDHFYKTVLSDPTIDTAALTDQLFVDKSGQTVGDVIFDLTPPGSFAPPMSHTHLVDLLWPTPQTGLRPGSARVGRFLISKRPISQPRKKSSQTGETGEIEIDME